MKQEDIKIGMVFTFGNHAGLEYVVINLNRNGVMLERITNRGNSFNRQVSNYCHFEHPLTKHLRTMDERELSKYQTKDPVCNLEKGVYRVKQNIDTLLDQPAVREHEVIQILEVCWDDYHGYQGEEYKLKVVYRQFGKENDSRLVFNGEEKMVCIHWFWKNFHKINIDQ